MGWGLRVKKDFYLRKYKISPKSGKDFLTVYKCINTKTQLKVWIVD